MRRPLVHSITVLSLGVTGAWGMTTQTAGAGEEEHRRAEVVRMEDDCHRRTFNAVLGPGACVGEGGTTFDELLAELVDRRSAGAWRFAPDEFEIRRGTVLRAVNEGGEVHSFTQVRRFGPGCVPEVNDLLGFPPGAMARECRTPAWRRTLRAPGTALRVRGLEVGSHRFACLIHPWMRATVQVRRADG